MCFRKWIFYHTSVSQFIQSPCLIYWCTRYDTLSFCCSLGTTSTSAIFTLHEVVWPAIDITMATRKYFHPNNLFFILIFWIFPPPLSYLLLVFASTQAAAHPNWNVFFCSQDCVNWMPHWPNKPSRNEMSTCGLHPFFFWRGGGGAGKVC